MTPWWLLVYPLLAGGFAVLLLRFLLARPHSGYYQPHSTVERAALLVAVTFLVSCLLFILFPCGDFTTVGAPCAPLRTQFMIIARLAYT